MSNTLPSQKIFSLTPTHNPHRWYMPITSAGSVGPADRQFMFGGVGLASAITAMEKTCGRQTVWATAQYLSYARPGDTLDLDVIVPVSGKYNTQARVVGHIDDREILTVNAALGSRPGEISEQWVEMPKVPRPMDCEMMGNWKGQIENLHDHIESRLVKGKYGSDRVNAGISDDGHVVMWCRMKDNLPVDSGAIAIMADFVPSAIGNAIGRNAGGNSLDNTIRFREIVETEWVLCDIKIHSVHNGFSHGRMHLFAEDGTLLASASQSAILRVHD